MQKVIINLYFVIKIGEEVQLKLGDSEAMPWEDESFDVILCNASSCLIHLCLVLKFLTYRISFWSSYET